MNWFGKKKEPTNSTTSSRGNGGSNAASTIVTLKGQIENQEKRCVRYARRVCVCVCGEIRTTPSNPRIVLISKYIFFCTEWLMVDF